MQFATDRLVSSGDPLVILNSKALAGLGYTPWLIQGIKTAGRAWGDSPFCGRYVFEDDIRAWLAKHPDFVASHSIRSKPQRTPTDLPVEAGCRSDAQGWRSAQQMTSPGRLAPQLAPAE